MALQGLEVVHISFLNKRRYVGVSHMSVSVLSSISIVLFILLVHSL